MERYCSTGQSPQRAVAPTEAEEEAPANIPRLELTFFPLLMFTGQQDTCDCTAVACSMGLKGTEFSGSNSCITGGTHSQPSRWIASYWSCPSHWSNQVCRIHNLSRTLEPCCYASLFWDITAQYAHINHALTLPYSLSGLLSWAMYTRFCIYHLVCLHTHCYALVIYFVCLLLSCLHVERAGGNNALFS